MTATEQHYKEKWGFPPAVWGIGVGLDLRSTSTAFDHLARLKEKEFIQTITGSPRAVRITDKGMEELKHE